MAAFNRDQEYIFLLIISLVGSGFILGLTDAQTFTVEDRGSILKFMDVLMNFLDLETENGTTTTSTVEPSIETTSLITENSTSEATTDTDTTSGSISDSTSSSTTNSTVGQNSTTTEATTTTTVRKRICFKRYCYKFSNDRGYIV
ncbi:hypothetical protein KR009_003065 [Drosophila setifemur]|nr:hypothetical protein KR009_003065 [Drosophila setifemur]